MLLSGVVKKKLILFFLNNEKNSNFLSYLVRPSHFFSSIKKILLKMFAMLIKNSLYISGVFIKISKMCSKMAYNNNKKIQTAYTSELQLKRTLFWVFLISFKTCYAFEFYISTLKQKKLTMSKKKKKKKYLIEKWKWKQQKNEKKTVHRLLYHHQNYCERESSLHHFICETSDIHGDRRDCVRIKLLFSKKKCFVFNFAFTSNSSDSFTNSVTTNRRVFQQKLMFLFKLIVHKSK